MTTHNQDSESAAHLKKLEALFAGSTNTVSVGKAASSMRTVNPPRAVFSNPRKSLGRAPSEYRLRLERLRMAREPEEIKTAANAFLEHHQLPDDTDVLLKVLCHPTESVLREAMGQLSALLMQGRLATTVILEDKLKTLATTVQEDVTHSYIQGLQQQLDKIKN